MTLPSSRTLGRQRLSSDPSSQIKAALQYLRPPLKVDCPVTADGSNHDWTTAFLVGTQSALSTATCSPWNPRGLPRDRQASFHGWNSPFLLGTRPRWYPHGLPRNTLSDSQTSPHCRIPRFQEVCFPRASAREANWASLVYHGGRILPCQEAFFLVGHRSPRSTGPEFLPFGVHNKCGPGGDMGAKVCCQSVLYWRHCIGVWG